MHPSECFLVGKFDSLLTKLIVDNLKVSNSTPKLFTGECNTVCVNVIWVNNTSIHSHFFSSFNVISGNNPNSDRFWLFFIWIWLTIL